MSTVLVSTGVQFPNGSVQTVAASGLNHTATVLYSGDTGSGGSAGLSQSMANFDFLEIWGAGGHRATVTLSVVSLIAQGTTSHLISGYSTTHNWWNRASNTSINVSPGNAAITKVIGIKLT